MKTAADRDSGTQQPTPGTEIETWRARDASLITRINAALKPGETLLECLSGRVAGGPHARIAVSAAAVAAPFVDLALTDERMLLLGWGSLGPGTIRSRRDFALADVRAVTVQSVGMVGTMPQARLTIELTSGKAIRIRLSGEHDASSGERLAGVAAAMSVSGVPLAAGAVCGSCGRAAPDPGRFCPYCGSARREADDAAGQPGRSPVAGGGTQSGAVPPPSSASDIIDEPANNPEPAQPYVAIATAGIPLDEIIRSAQVSGPAESDATDIGFESDPDERAALAPPVDPSSITSDSAPERSELPSEPTPPPVVGEEYALPWRSGPLQVRIRIDRPELNMDTTFVGDSPEQIVRKIRTSIVPRLPFMARVLCGSMSELRFAQQVTSRFNEREGHNVPEPKSCEEFLRALEQLGYAEIAPAGGPR